MTPFEKITSRLPKVKIRGNKATAPCPAHNGKDFNLAVNEYSTGDAWPKCHSHQCTTREIMESIGLELKDGYASSATAFKNRLSDLPRLSSLPKRVPNLAGKLAVAEDPVMKAAAKAMDATPQELLEYVEQQKAKGLKDEEVRDVLKSLADSHGELEDAGDQKFNALTVRPVNQFMDEAKEEAIPSRLLGDLELQGDLIVVFGDTGVNKTVHAVQVADKITGGNSDLGLECELDQPLKTLFADFELSKKQWERRYSQQWENHYRFTDRFLRAEFDRNCKLPDGFNFEDYVLRSLEAEIAEKGIEYCVIDNKSAIRAATEKAQEAGRFMNELNRIKQKYSTTLKLMCHTPKRDASRPLSLNDLAGAANMRNLVDAVYGIGMSHTDPSIRYIKQFKTRHDDIKYGANNVILYRVTKPSNFLGLEFIGYGEERDHLAPSSTLERSGKRLGEAIEFFQRVLANGPVAIDQVKQKAEEEGISSITLRRAREELKIVSKFGAWSLPNTSKAPGLTDCKRCGKSCPEVSSGLCINCEEK